MTDEEYILMCSLEDKYTKEPTVWELSQVFPDCREIAKRIAYDLEQDLKIYDEAIKNEPFIRIFKSIDPRYQRLQKIKKYLNFTKPSVSGGIEQSDIEKAKSVPIHQLYDFDISRETSKRIQTKCPFHDEKIPSFFIFKEQNRFHCFSCQEGGDSIAFIMKLNNLTFLDAVKTIIK